MSQSIAFAVIEGKKNAQACITQKNLLQFHISSPDKNSEKAILLKRDDDLGDCLNLAEMILNHPFVTMLTINAWISMSPGMDYEELSKLC